MSLNTSTRDAVSTFVRREVTRFIEERASVPDQTEFKPFHARLMPLPFEAWSRWSERSFSTRSGGWFQHIAGVVAKQYHPVVENNYAVSGEVRAAAAAHIEQLIALMNVPSNRRVPDRAKDISEVMAVQGAGGSPRNTVADLFIRRSDGHELYFEIKTPQPNKGQCIEMKTRMLLTTALRHGHSVDALAACAYNPFGEDADFATNSSGWVRQFLDVGNDFLVGRQFWEVIGDGDTYGNLLEIAAEIGSELTPLFEKYALDDEDGPSLSPSQPT